MHRQRRRERAQALITAGLDYLSKQRKLQGSGLVERVICRQEHALRSVSGLLNETVVEYLKRRRVRPDVMRYPDGSEPCAVAQGAIDCGPPDAGRKIIDNSTKVGPVADRRPAALSARLLLAAVSLFLAVQSSVHARAGNEADSYRRLPAAGQAPTPRAAQRPHIVMIMLDDLDAASLAQLLAAGLMPNLATYVLDSGYEFRNHIVTNPVCCPSRATYFTGRYTHNNGVRSNVFAVDTGEVQLSGVFDGEEGPVDMGTEGTTYKVLGGVGSLDDTDTVGVRMSAGGYVTAHVGKYLTGYGQAPDFAYVHPSFAPDRKSVV